MDLRGQLQATLGSSHTIERELGGGGMSRVFVAVDTALQRRIVIKVLPPEMAAEISVARFQREIAVVARFQHPHIVPLLAAGETEGLPYYTMPLVEGESLRARLARAGEMPVNEAVRLLREIASALAYAHEKGVVHRDIKPDNVLVTGGIALVTDFGVAKALAVSTLSEREGLTATGIALGTPAYMAPEQATADSTADHRADLYAFGVVAYEMLTGQPPFAGRTAQGLVAAHLTESPESIAKRRPAVPASLAALVMRCLEKRPADRPQHASEIVQALDTVTTPTQADAAPRLASRKVSGAMLVALTLLVMGAAGGAWLWSNRGGAAGVAASSSRLLVAPFENLTGDARFDQIGRIAADRLAQRAAQLSSTDVVPSSTVLMSLRDTTGGLAQRIERLSVATQAGLLVTGTVVLRADSLVLQAQITDPRTGKITNSLDAASGPSSDPIAAIDALGDHLLGALGSRELTMLPQNHRAPKYAAYQQFAAGFDRFAIYGDNLGSRPFFERAIAIDSNYTRAYLLLCRQYINAGEFDRADSMVQRIERLPMGLMASERLQLDYSKAELNGDIAGLLRAQQQLASREPSPIGFNLMGEAANWLLRPDIALPALAQATDAYRLIGGMAVLHYTSMRAEAYHQAGMYQQQNSVLLDRRSGFPLIIDLPAGQLRAFAGMHQSAAAVALADTMLRGSADSSGRAAFFVTTGALEFRAHGDRATSDRLLTMSRTWYASHPSRQAPPRRMLAEGVAMLASGMPDSAATRFAMVARDTTVLDAAGYLALARLASGDRARARAIADSLGGLQRKWLFGAHTFWRAAVLGALGERELAIQLLQQAHREGRSMESWHYSAALEPLHAYGPFEDLIRPRR